jgi:ribosomal protein S18 acetylase RimI-like enzyme
MTKLPLESARPDHTTSIANWARTAEELEWWCGHKTYPLEPAVMLGWQADPDVRAFVLSDESPIAYGELWLDAEENEVELARLIVAPQHRGRGIGRTLVRGLLEVARGTGFPMAFLRVVPENQTARACYEAVGFSRVEPNLEAQFNAGQPRAYAWYRSALD